MSETSPPATVELKATIGDGQSCAMTNDAEVGLSKSQKKDEVLHQLVVSNGYLILIFQNLKINSYLENMSTTFFQKRLLRYFKALKKSLFWKTNRRIPLKNFS